jgi:hypothetical protein
MYYIVLTRVKLELQMVNYLFDVLFLFHMNLVVPQKGII